jgi:hypothetical protein
LSQEALTAAAALTTQDSQSATQTQAEQRTNSQSNVIDPLTLPSLLDSSSTASTSDTASNDSLNNLVLDIENALKSLSSNKNTSAQSTDKDNDGDQK